MCFVFCDLYAEPAGKIVLLCFVETHRQAVTGGRQTSECQADESGGRYNARESERRPWQQENERQPRGPWQLWQQENERQPWQ